MSMMMFYYADFNYYGGDIVLTEQQKELLLGRKDVMEGYSDTETEAAADEKAHSVNRRAVTRISVNLWPSGVVPYVLDSSLSKQFFTENLLSLFMTLS